MESKQTRKPSPPCRNRAGVNPSVGSSNGVWKRQEEVSLVPAAVISRSTPASLRDGDNKVINASPSTFAEPGALSVYTEASSLWVRRYRKGKEGGGGPKGNRGGTSFPRIGRGPSARPTDSRHARTHSRRQDKHQFFRQTETYPPRDQRRGGEGEGTISVGIA